MMRSRQQPWPGKEATRSPTRHCGHASPERLDPAGAFGTRRERQLRPELVFAGKHQRVEEIQAHDRDAHQHFAWSRLRLRHLGELERLGAAELSTKNGFHDVSRPAARGRRGSPDCKMPLGCVTSLR